MEMLSTLQMTLVRLTAIPFALPHLTFKKVCARRAVPTTRHDEPRHQGCTNRTMSALRRMNTTRIATTNNAILSLFVVCAQVQKGEIIHLLIAGVELQCCRMMLNSSDERGSGLWYIVYTLAVHMQVSVDVECCLTVAVESGSGSEVAVEV